MLLALSNLRGVVERLPPNSSRPHVEERVRVQRDRYGHSAVQARTRLATHPHAERGDGNRKKSRARTRRSWRECDRTARSSSSCRARRRAPPLASSAARSKLTSKFARSIFRAHRSSSNASRRCRNERKWRRPWSSTDLPALTGPGSGLVYAASWFMGNPSPGTMISGAGGRYPSALCGRIVRSGRAIAR